VSQVDAWIREILFSAISFILCGKLKTILKYVSDILHGKNGFAEIFKNLARYRSENNVV